MKENHLRVVLLLLLLVMTPKASKAIANQAAAMAATLPVTTPLLTTPSVTIQTITPPATPTIVTPAAIMSTATSKPLTTQNLITKVANSTTTIIKNATTSTTESQSKSPTMIVANRTQISNSYYYDYENYISNSGFTNMSISNYYYYYDYNIGKPSNHQHAKTTRVSATKIHTTIAPTTNIATKFVTNLTNNTQSTLNSIGTSENMTGYTLAGSSVDISTLTFQNSDSSSILAQDISNEPQSSKAEIGIIFYLYSYHATNH